MTVVFRALSKTARQSTFFYGPDSHLNLELHIGDADGYLNTWIDSMAQKGRNPFVASDNMFANAIPWRWTRPKE